MKAVLFNEMFDLEYKHWWFIARREIIRKLLKHFLVKGSSPSILEIGCGTGGNLALLNEFGNIYATELDDYARNLANSRGLITVEKGSLPSDIPFQRQFNLICLFDVLEHIENDHNAIQRLCKLLDDNGLVFITVPAYPCMWSYHDELNHHFRRYTQEQLINRVEKNGLKVIYKSYFNTHLFPLIFIARKCTSWLHKESPSDLKLPNSFINNILNLIFSSERHWLPRFSLPFGLSIIVVAAKN